jgi:hypothetical protein
MTDKNDALVSDDELGRVETLWLWTPFGGMRTHRCVLARIDRDEYGVLRDTLWYIPTDYHPLMQGFIHMMHAVALGFDAWRSEAECLGAVIARKRDEIEQERQLIARLEERLARIAPAPPDRSHP